MGNLIFSADVCKGNFCIYLDSHRVHCHVSLDFLLVEHSDRRDLQLFFLKTGEGLSLIDTGRKGSRKRVHEEKIYKDKFDRLNALIRVTLISR